MTVEFVRNGKTYQCSLTKGWGAPPALLTIPFKPCVLRPPVRLELAHVATDDIRGVEIYRPVAEGVEVPS